MLAYDFPILGLFWSMLIFFMWIAWIMLVFRVIMDIFANSEMKGIAKAFWLLFVIVLPWLGVLIYLLVNGTSMTDRSIERAAGSPRRFLGLRSPGCRKLGRRVDEAGRPA